MATAAAETVPAWMQLPGLEWLLAEHVRQKLPPTTIQTLIFPKTKWSNLNSVKEWAKDHGFKNTNVDETGTSWRLRQRPPGDFKTGSFRTICLAGADEPDDDDCRVKAVIGRLKEGKKAKKKSAPPAEEELTMPKHRIRQSYGLCLDRTHLGTRQQAPNGEEYDHRFVASTETLASDGGVILLSAWRLARYQARPRWIAMHDVYGFSGKLTEISLGKAVWAAIEDGFPISQVGETGRALVVYVRYASTDFAQEVKMLYEEGGLDDVSVRWDPRTEVVRNPFEEEVQKFGDGIKWVAERADLIELSAVLLGADQGPNMAGGAQLMREAFARCRSAGHELKEVPKLIDRIEGMTRERQDDEAAMTDSLGLLQQAIDAFDTWLMGAGDIREALGDAVANLAALLSQEQETGTTSAGEDADDDERQGGLTVDKLRAAVEALTEAIEKLMATRAAADDGDGDGGGAGEGGDGGDAGAAEGGDGTRGVSDELAEQIDAMREQLEGLAKLIEERGKAGTTKQGKKGKGAPDDDEDEMKGKGKKKKKGSTTSGGDQAGGEGGEKYVAGAKGEKGCGKKKDDELPEGGERGDETEGDGSQAGTAEGGEGAGDGDAGADGGDEGGDAGEGEGDGEGRVSWSELSDDDEVEIDFEAIAAEGSESEAGHK